jgi:opacity protein-like surface antigen
MLKTNCLKGLMVLSMSFFIFDQTIAQTTSTKKDEVKATKADEVEVKKEAPSEKREAVPTTVETASDRQIHSHALGIGLGETFLFGKMENYGDNKITGELLYSYTASYSFDLLVSAHRSSHEYKDKKVDILGYSASIKGRYYEYDAFSPYVLGGLGFYLPRIDFGDETSEEKWAFGVNAGAGVDLRLNESVVIGVLGHFHKPFDIKQDETPRVSGSYFKLLMTAMYIF